MHVLSSRSEEMRAPSFSAFSFFPPVCLFFRPDNEYQRAKKCRSDLHFGEKKPSSRFSGAAVEFKNVHFQDFQKDESKLFHPYSLIHRTATTFSESEGNLEFGSC